MAVPAQVRGKLGPGKLSAPCPGIGFLDGLDHQGNAGVQVHAAPSQGHET